VNPAKDGHGGHIVSSDNRFFLFSGNSTWLFLGHVFYLEA